MAQTAAEVRRAWFGADVPDGGDRFCEFQSDAVSGLELGADALLYVMAHGHTISVPTQALYFAEKVAVVSIRRQQDSDGRPVDPHVAVLADVNRAIDTIAASLRTREAIDREGAAGAAPAACQPAEDVPGGQKSKLIAPQPVQPPGAASRPIVAEVVQTGTIRF